MSRMNRSLLDDAEPRASRTMRVARLRSRITGLCLCAVPLAASTPVVSAAAESAPAQALAAPVAAKTGYVAVGALHMYYEVRGSGPDLVLLHGGGSTIGTSFGRVIDQLARTHRVIAFEQQGHGRTADIDRPFDFAQMADDTAAAMTKLGVARADVIGFSHGGIVAMQLVTRHPAQVRRLVLASTWADPVALRPETRRVFAAPVDINQMPPALKADYLRLAPDPSKLPQQADKLMAANRTYAGIAHAALHAISAPTLVLAGDRDIMTPAQAAAMADSIPKARLVILPGPHGQYLGEASSPADPGLVRASVEILEDFLDAAPSFTG